jgi:ABC-type multidrug transport system fused ATPase/permease subunit
MTGQPCPSTPALSPQPGREPRDNRQQAIRREINRLSGRLEQLNARHQRWAWARLLSFGLAMLSGYAALRYLESWAAILVGLAGLAVFSASVAYHRLLSRQSRLLTLWRKRRCEQLSRLELDWSGIPAPAVELMPSSQCCLEIDLDLAGFRSLHQLLDLGISYEGSQRLAEWLNPTKPDSASIHARQSLVRELAGLSRFRDRLVSNLHQVSTERLRGSSLLKWLQAEAPGRRIGWLLGVSSLFCLLNLVILLLNLSGQASPAWFMGYGFYLIFYFSTIGQISPFLESVVELSYELDKFRQLLAFLEKYPYRQGSHLAERCSIFTLPVKRPSRRLQGLSLVTAAVGLRSNLILGLLLNLVLPWDYATAFLASRLQSQAGDYLPGWLETWTELEACCCLADFAWLNPQYTFPRVDESVSPALQARSLGHPLIPYPKKISNNFSFSGDGQVVLITGSNMAGKSTFIKTIGINLCLAYAGGPVDAQELRLRPFRLHTCIRITDSISDGYSYFYAEVRCLKALLEKLEQTGAMPVLYLVDEIFRGTNNRERFLGSQAFIRRLAGANGCGLIATHDLELARLEQESPLILNFHFEDQVSEGRLTFNYCLRPGPSRTTNALKIMEMEGLPIS